MAHLAKSVGDRGLSDNLAAFELKTGPHLQLIRLPDDEVLAGVVRVDSLDDEADVVAPVPDEVVADSGDRSVSADEQPASD